MRLTMRSPGYASSTPSRVRVTGEDGRVVGKSGAAVSTWATGGALARHHAFNSRLFGQYRKRRVELNRLDRCP
jgi:hypothetical protein